MAFVLVPKELVSGKIGGVDYGSQVRLLVRSPLRLLINGVGLNVITNRASFHHQDEKNLARGRCTKAVLEDLRPRIDGYFGEGITDAVLEAWKTGSTVIIDGGGDTLPLSLKHSREKHAREHAAVTINQDVSLTGRIPKCLQCAKDLQPKKTIHNMGHAIQADHPRSLADCQKMTNYEVVTVRDYRETTGRRVGFVEWFETWDGYSVFDPHFCGDICAAKFGRRAAATGVVLPVGIEPERIVWTHNGINHYDTAAPKEMTLPDGSVIKV